MSAAPFVKLIYPGALLVPSVSFALVCCDKSHACHFPCSILPARQVASTSMHVLYQAWMLLHVLGSACSVLLVCGMLPDAAWVCRHVAHGCHQLPSTLHAVHILCKCSAVWIGYKPCSTTCYVPSQACSRKCGDAGCWQCQGAVRSPRLDSSH